MRAKPALFRERIYYSHQDDLGPLIRWHFPHPRLWVGAFCLLFAGLAAVVMRLEYSEKVAVEGRVRPAQQPVALLARDAGIVQQMLVRDGDPVRAEQPLLQIDRSIDGPDGRSDYQRAIASVQTELQALQQEEVHTGQVYAAEHAALEHRRAGLAARRNALMQSLELAVRRSDLVTADDQRVQQLAARGWVSRREAHGSAMTLLDAMALVAARRDQLDQLEIEVEQARYALVNLSEQQALLLQQIGARRGRLQAGLRDARQGAAVLVNAPVDGVVADAQAVPGQQVVAGQFLLTVSPDARDAHEVDLWLPSSAAGRVRPGMVARLRYAGFPFQDFGHAIGHVRRVSDAPRMVEGQALFRARVEVGELPGGISEVPAGMLVHADLIVQSKPLWAWLIEPLLAWLDRL